MRIALGFMAAKHLFVADEIRVFEKLASGAATLDEPAAATGIPYRTLRISADAMVSLGLLEREDRRYRNAAVAAAFLAGAPGPDLRPMLRFWDKLSYPRWVGLESAVRSGEDKRVSSASARRSSKSSRPGSRHFRPLLRQRLRRPMISAVTSVSSTWPAGRAPF